MALAVAALSWYGGTALLLEDLRQGAVLPVVRRGASAQALDGGLPEQTARLAHEAGVRQQL